MLRLYGNLNPWNQLLSCFSFSFQPSLHIASLHDHLLAFSYAPLRRHPRLPHPICQRTRGSQCRRSRFSPRPICARTCVRWRSSLAVVVRAMCSCGCPTCLSSICAPPSTSPMPSSCATVCSMPRPLLVTCSLSDRTMRWYYTWHRSWWAFRMGHKQVTVIVLLYSVSLEEVFWFCKLHSVSVGHVLVLLSRVRISLFVCEALLLLYCGRTFLV